MRTWGAVAVMVAAAAVMLAAPPALAATGGKPCTLNVECGIPAANMAQLREEAVSTTGSCVNGFCECQGAYTCSNCFINGNSELSYTSAPSGTFDVCEFSFGGGVCTADSQCGNGLCLGGKCVCYSGWSCEYCSLAVVQDLQNHAQCGNFTTGYGTCADNDDCGGSSHGQCINGQCQCAASYVCEDCSATRDAILSGIATCPCVANQCSGHGTCSNGQCDCEINYSGAACTVDLCSGVDCSGHGTCSAGTCECTGGYTGERCNTGGGNCATNADCGYYAPIAGLADQYSQCSDVDCVDNMYGGNCTNGQCVCASGFTCETCTAKGTGSCEEARGGGSCSSNTDCGTFDGGATGGMCIEGRCLCFPGYVCPSCHIVGPLAAGETCAVDRSQATGGANCTRNEDCGVRANGDSGGSCNAQGECECYTGFYCPSCNTVDEPDFNAGEKCPIPAGGGGECFSSADCANGECVANKCMCYQGYDCEYCNARQLVVGERIPGNCTQNSDCGNGAGVIGGTCTDGECVCYNGFKCSYCDKWLPNDECPPDNFVRENDTLVCPPPPTPTGGAACSASSDCGNVGDGLYGGQCADGRCLCWGGYTCADCSRTTTQLAAGMPCAAAMATVISWTVTLAAMLLVAWRLL